MLSRVSSARRDKDGLEPFALPLTPMSWLRSLLSSSRRALFGKSERTLSLSRPGESLERNEVLDDSAALSGLVSALRDVTPESRSPLSFCRRCHLSDGILSLGRYSLVAVAATVEAIRLWWCDEFSERDF